MAGRKRATKRAANVALEKGPGTRRGEWIPSKGEQGRKEDKGAAA